MTGRVLVAGWLAAGAAACGAPERAGREPARSDTAMAETLPPQQAGWAVMLRGAGPIRFGMTVLDAATAAGVPLTTGGDGCSYVAPSTAPPGLRFMIENDRVVRADVDSVGTLTDRGAAIGMTEAEIRRLYPESLVVMPHKYLTTGTYLIHVPGEPADSAYRILFELDSGRVVRYRAGLVPQVEYVEGCG